MTNITAVHASMLKPINDAWVDSRVPAIARRLQERDSRLEIRANVGKKGQEIEQYEIFWANQFVARFLPGEVDEIYDAMLKLDSTTPGFERTIDKLEKQEAERERDASRKFEDVYTEMATHYRRMLQDTEDGVSHFHGQAGVGESKLQHGK